MPEIQALIDGEARSNNSQATSPQTWERAEIASWVWGIFNNKRSIRDQKLDLFRDRTFIEYLDNCKKRFIQFKRRPEWKKKWQSNLASSTPNEKLIGILSKLATQGMEAKVINAGEINKVNIWSERIFNYMLKSAAVKNDDDFQIILEMMEAMEKGTVIGFEDWYSGTKVIKEISEFDPETGEIKFNEKKIKEWNDVRSMIVPLENFYPGNLYVRPGKIQDMDDCFLRSIMTEDEFDEEFGEYTDADKVMTVSSWVNESTPFWQQSNDVGNDYVEVIRYFNKKTDEYVIIANGVWINPVGKKKICPLPWNHKKLPFWAFVSEPLDGHFFYGRSFIDKLISFCDAKDALFDRILDQVTLAISKPIITDGSFASAFTKGFLQPNNVITVDYTNGKPNLDVLPIQDPSPVAFNLYQLLQTNIEQSSITSEVLGGQSVRKKTAEEVATQREAANQIVSLFLSLAENGIKEKNKLRFANLLQFYSMPNIENDEYKFKVITLNNEKMMDGSYGKVSIKVTPMPSQENVEMMKNGIYDNVEFIEISPDFIRNWQADIQIVAQSSIKMSEAQRMALEINYQKIMAELYPDKFNRDAGFEELNLKFNKDPDKMKAKQPQQLPGQEQMPGMEAAGQPNLGGSLSQLMQGQNA